MTQDAFSFLCATFYRWAQLFPTLCSKLAGAPKVLGIGDLHVENYGTWRDAEGRLVWGINDFVEACPLPYTNDLVRLATSACLAIEADDLTLRRGVACTVILEGYATGVLEGSGRPVVLSEHHRWLRDAVTSRLRDPAKFWQKLAARPAARAIPTEVRSLLEAALPKPRKQMRMIYRRPGLGSLGRPRFTALAEWRGGKVARETKALLPSAWLWAAGAGDDRIYYDECMRHAVRAPDPFLRTQGAWILKRLSPHCSRIELKQMPRWRDEQKLLWMMGYELANVHLGTRGARARIRADLRRHKPKWLRQSAERMAEATLADWKEWKRKTA